MQEVMSKDMTKIVDVPKIGKLNIEKVVDCTTARDSNPQFTTKRAIDKMLNGQIGEVILSDPYAVEYITTLLAVSDAEYLGVVEKDNVWCVYFRKGKKK